MIKAVKNIRACWIKVKLRSEDIRSLYWSQIII